VTIRAQDLAEVADTLVFSPTRSVPIYVAPYAAWCALHDALAFNAEQAEAKAAGRPANPDVAPVHPARIAAALAQVIPDATPEERESIGLPGMWRIIRIACGQAEQVLAEIRHEVAATSGDPSGDDAGNVPSPAPTKRRAPSRRRTR